MAEQEDSPFAEWRTGSKRARGNGVQRLVRRGRTWDYRGRGAYLLTLSLVEGWRERFGELVPGSRPTVVPTELGRCVEESFRRFGASEPGLEVLGTQLMPDHLHGVVRVNRRLLRTLGAHVTAFKRAADGLFSPDLQVAVLDDEAAVTRALDYIHDNPRRLWERLAHPGLFQTAREIGVPLELDAGAGARAGFAHFQALGNHHLLARAHLLQVQCARGAGDPSVVDGYLAAAGLGAVLVSAGLSDGERDILRRACAAGAGIVLLRAALAEGVVGLGAPFGAASAAGRLLQLAPVAWPPTPHGSRPTKVEACILSRLALLLAGRGAAPGDGLVLHPGTVDARLARAVRFSACAANAWFRPFTLASPSAVGYNEGC